MSGASAGEPLSFWPRAIAERTAENLQLRVFDLLEFSPEQVRAYLEAQGRTDLRSRISEVGVQSLPALGHHPRVQGADRRSGPTEPRHAVPGADRRLHLRAGEEADDPTVVERLVAALDRSSPTSNIASSALKSRSTVHTIRALVKACLASSEPTGTSAARALRDSTKAEPRRVAAALSRRGAYPNADAAAVTGLGVYVDTDWLDKRQGVAEALVSAARSRRNR